MMCLERIHDGCYAKTVKKSFLISRRAASGAAIGAVGGAIGGNAGRGATIDEETGRMAVAIVDNDYTFSLFGACTIP